MTIYDQYKHVRICTDHHGELGKKENQIFDMITNIIYLLFVRIKKWIVKKEEIIIRWRVLYDVCVLMHNTTEKHRGQ